MTSPSIPFDRAIPSELEQFLRIATTTYVRKYETMKVGW